MTEEEARKLHKVIIEIGLGQDRRADKMMEMLFRQEEHLLRLELVERRLHEREKGLCLSLRASVTEAHGKGPKRHDGRGDGPGKAPTKV